MHGGPQMWGNDQVEVSGARGERIHLMQNKGYRFLLNTPQGSGGQDNRGEAVYNEAVGGKGAVFKRGRWGGMACVESSLFW